MNELHSLVAKQKHFIWINFFAFLTVYGHFTLEPPGFILYLKQPTGADFHNMVHTEGQPVTCDATLSRTVAEKKCYYHSNLMFI